MNGTSGRVYVKDGGRYNVSMPFSEVCLHMQVAGSRMIAEFRLTRHGAVAQLFTLDGFPFSSPILACEAGIFGPTTEGDYYTYGEEVSVNA